MAKERAQAQSGQGKERAQQPAAPQTPAHGSHLDPRVAERAPGQPVDQQGPGSSTPQDPQSGSPRY